MAKLVCYIKVVTRNVQYMYMYVDDVTRQGCIITLYVTWQPSPRGVQYQPRDDVTWQGCTI